MSKHVFIASNVFSVSPGGQVFHLSQWVFPLTITELEYHLIIKYVLIPIDNLFYIIRFQYEKHHREKFKELFLRKYVS